PAHAENHNGTRQSNHPVPTRRSCDPNGAGAGDDINQTQSSGNTNSTSETGTANATTDQTNTYTPTVFFCNRCLNGDVSQSNDADTHANAENNNDTGQSNVQDQSAGGG